LLPNELRRPLTKLEQAFFHLEHLKSEVRRPSVEFIAVESYLSGCLGALQGAFYVLRHTQPKFKSIFRKWRDELRQEDREFFNRMIAERDADVHAGGTSLFIQFTITIRPQGQTGDTELRLGVGGKDHEIVAACERFIAFMADLIKQFRNV
jgi:hypothetical protein